MNYNRRHIYGLITCLILFGIGIFLYRFLVLDVPLSNTKNINSWEIEANLRFAGDNHSPVKANFAIPYMPPHYTILDEYFISKNYGITTYLNGNNRRVAWSLRRGRGMQSLYYRAIIRETDHHESSLPKPKHLPKANPLLESQKTAVATITSKARESSADIQSFAQSTLKELNKRDGNATRLVGRYFKDEQLVKAAIIILNQARIHAIPVWGIDLTEYTKTDFRMLLAVYNDKEWIYLDPYTASVGLPQHFLLWQYGDAPMVEMTGGKYPRLAITVSPTPMNALSVAKARGLQNDSKLLRFSLLQLPVDAQETYKVLLTVPIGAFIILLLRNFVGLTTFGTFMPVLIALAFRETHVIWGTILFTLIISFGLLARFYLEGLKLLLVPRLASILTIVIFSMIFIGILSQNLGLDIGLSVALFPMVILTMVIERMCIIWDERGPFDAIKSGVGSLAAAIICFGVMSYSPLQYLMFAFPELLFVLLGLILLFGQYRGYRLMELFRFKALANVG